MKTMPDFSATHLIDVKITTCNSLGLYVYTVGDTGFEIHRVGKSLQAHFRPDGHTERPEDNNLICRNVLLYSLAIDVLIKNWYSLGFDKFSDYIHGSTNIEMNNHRHTLFQSIQDLSRPVIYSSEVYSRAIPDFFAWTLNVKELILRVNYLETGLSGEELLKTKYFKRLYQARECFKLSKNS